MKYPIEYVDKSEYFKKMYDVHETIKTIKENIDKLYASADYISPSFNGVSNGQPNPNKIVNAISEAAELRAYADYLLKERAKFDLFVCTLLPDEKKVLSMRYESSLGWKEIASQLNIGVTTAKEILRKINKKMDDCDQFSTNSSESDL